MKFMLAAAVSALTSCGSLAASAQQTPPESASEAANATVNLDLGGFPATAAGHVVSMREYRIDAETSNYWTDAANANLQQVSETTFTLGNSHQVIIDLPPNAVHLITLDVESSHGN